MKIDHELWYFEQEIKEKSIFESCLYLMEISDEWKQCYILLIHKTQVQKMTTEAIAVILTIQNIFTLKILL